MRGVWVIVLAAALLACGQSAPAAPAFTPVANLEAGATTPADAPIADPLPAPKGDTWSYLYATYFAGTSSAVTPGHCGEGRCHLNLFHGFRCGADGNTCYAGMVGVGLVNPSDPKSSWIGRADTSMLYWINPVSGIMPLDEAKPNPQGAADILAWLDAGATNDLPPPEAGIDAGEASSSDAPSDASPDAPADASTDAALDAPSGDATAP